MLSHYVQESTKKVFKQLLNTNNSASDKGKNLLYLKMTDKKILI